MVVNLARKLVTIPSEAFKEADIAEFCDAYMQGVGMETELQLIQVNNQLKSKQVIGRFRGSERHPSLMFLSHLDAPRPWKFELWTKKPGEIEGNWLYGNGGQKCGIAAMIVASKAVNEALKLKGDIIVACVMGESAGGIGSNYMLDKGIIADMAIVAEDTDLEFTTISVGSISGRIHTEGNMREDWMNTSIKRIHPIEKMFKVINSLGPTHKPAKPGGWLTFEPHLGLPGFPQMRINSIETKGDFCTISFKCRIVPRQTEETIKRDLENLMTKLKAEDRDLKVEIEIPCKSPYTRNLPAFEISKEEYIVKTLAKWHKYVTNKEPVYGAGCRLGVSSDACNLMAAGIKTINYGPGPMSILVVNERKPIEDIVNAAKVYALTAAEICY